MGGVAAKSLRSNAELVVLKALARGDGNRETRKLKKLRRWKPLSDNL